MEEKRTGRTRIIGLRLTPAEYIAVEQSWKKTTIRKLSEFVRHMIFGKPVTSYSRNQSLDELIVELMLLRKDLNAIGVNFNQVVHRLHTLDHLPQMQLWLQRFEGDKEAIAGQIDAIKLRVDSISDQWLQ